MTFLLNLITAAVLYGTPLLYGTSGEILTEKSGNLNLGVEGMMFMGGALGLGAAFYYEKLAGAAVSAPLAVVIAIAGSFLAGAAGALIFSFLTITLRANQNVTGLALTIFGTGVGWLAVALVIFCLWSPYRAIWGSILFGGLLILYLRMPIDLIPDQIYKILPYVVTVVVLIFTSLRNNRDKQPPASLGLAYFREER